MRLILLLTLFMGLLSCTDREESIGGLIGDYTNGDSPKVKISSVEIHTDTGYTNINPIQVVINANSQASLMRVGLDEVCGVLPFVPFEANNTMTLQENLSQTIYIQAKDTEDERTECMEFPIVHDNLNPNAPSFTATGATQFFSTALTRSATTRWNVASDNGPAGIHHYEVAFSTTASESGMFTTYVSNTSRNYTRTSGLSLSLYTDYYSLVKSIDNATNESTVRVSPAWRVIYAPDQVTNVTLIESTSDSLEISWDDVTNEMGTTLTDYLIQYRIDGASSWTNFNDGTSTLSTTTITGLVPDTDYEIQIRARNANRYGAYSAIVTYSTLRTYKAYNVGGATANQIVSFEDDNELTLNGSPLVTLEQGQTHSFAGATFDMIEGSKPFYVAGALGSGAGAQSANVAWINEEYPGRDFYVSHFEGTDLIVNVYALEDTDVTITNGGDTYETQSLTAGSGYTFTLNAQLSYHISSTANILAYTYSNGNSTEYLSARPLLAASTNLLGTPYTSASINASADTNYTINYSSGSPQDSDDAFFEIPKSISSALTSIQVTAPDPIDITSYDAGPGDGASSFMPTSMMKTKYAVNVDASLVMIVSTSAINITRTNPDASTENLLLLGSGPYSHLLNPANVNAGTIFESSSPFAIWYVPASNVNGAQGDETLLFGWDE